MPSRDFLSRLRKESFQSFNFDIIKNREFNGFSPPSVFVGSYNYPKVYAGILNKPYSSDVDILEDYAFMANNLSSKEVVSLRSGLVNSRSIIRVDKNSNKFKEYLQNAAIASVKVEIETKFKRFSRFWNIDRDSSLFGVSYDVEKIKVYDDFKVDKRVEKVINDVDFRAEESVFYLYDKGVLENKISELFSTSQLGLGIKRRWVPTKWSITAVDDTIGKKIIEEIKSYDFVEEPMVFEGDLYGNFFKVLLIPRMWGFELMEIEIRSKKLKKYNRKDYVLFNDFEDYFGRREYAKQTVGGYYAIRLAVLEFLRSVKKQAYALVLREIRDYDMPMGVWVVREGVRKTMKNRSVFFEEEFKDKVVYEIYSDFIGHFLKDSFSGVSKEELMSRLNTTKVLKQSNLADYL